MIGKVQIYEVPYLPCDHPSFMSNVVVNRLLGPGGQVNYMAEVRIKCENCLR